LAGRALDAPVRASAAGVAPLSDRSDAPIDGGAPPRRNQSAHSAGERRWRGGGGAGPGGSPVSASRDLRAGPGGSPVSARIRARCSPVHGCAALRIGFKCRAGIVRTLPPGCCAASRIGFKCCAGLVRGQRFAVAGAFACVLQARLFASVWSICLGSL